jgi:aryl-alcohol dehydrogenase-like predicted oxidoreductase
MKDLTKIVLGTAQMGLEYGINNTTGKIHFQESIKILEYAFESGIRTLDTAEAYGSAHQIIGAYHKLNPSCKFNIITKLPKTIEDNAIEQKVEEYLNELQICQIDTLMCHDYTTFYENKILANWLINSKGTDFVNKIGVSTYNNLQVVSLIQDCKKVDVIQLPFNLLDNFNQRGGVLMQMKSMGVIAHTRSPFLQGMFFVEKKMYNSVFVNLSPYLSKLKKIANLAGVSMHSLALQYSFLNPLSNAVILGIDSLEQLKLNLNALDNEFIGENIIGLIDDIIVEDIDLLNPSLWK